MMVKNIVYYKIKKIAYPCTSVIPVLTQLKVFMAFVIYLSDKTINPVLQH